METCPDCGCRIYKFGCVNCNEPAYIAEQVALTEQYGNDDPPRSKARSRSDAEWAGYPLTWGDEG